MAGLKVKDLLSELEPYSSRQFDLMNPLMDLTSDHENTMRKYLGLSGGESWPLLAEYLGVALAFAALGALIRDAHGTAVKEEVNDDFQKPQRPAIQTMLKGAMERLQYLAQNAQDLEERLTNWDHVKASFVQKLNTAEEEIKELRVRRAEDAKANDKVAQIYATREQGWKFEKKKLRHEIDILKKDPTIQEASELHTLKASLRKRQCEGCDAKKRRIRELEKAILEKEDVALTAKENVRTKGEEIRVLTSNLAAVTKTVVQVNEQLRIELANSADRETILDEVRNRQHEAECQLAKAVEELDNTKTHLQALSLVTEKHSEVTRSLISELAILRQETEDKDVMISTMLERSEVEKQEKEDLARLIAGAQAGKELGNAQTTQWRRVAEDSTRRNLFAGVPYAGRSGHRNHRSLGNPSELEEVAALQRFQPWEIDSLLAPCSAGSTPNGALLPGIQDPSSDPEIVARFEMVKRRQTMYLEDKHWTQIESFERQLRVKDERLSVFRSKLIALESELAQSRKEGDEWDSSTAVEVCTTGIKSKQVGSTSPNLMEVLERAVYTGEAMTYQRSLEKLLIELKNVTDKLSQKNAEHNSIVKKMAENAKADLQNKDMQLTDLQTKLCQVQQQLNEVRLANEMSSSQKCEEEKFLANMGLFHEPKTEDVQFSSPCYVVDSRMKVSERRLHTEESALQEDSASASAKLLTKLKDMCLKEDNPPALVRFHRQLELNSSDDFVFSSDDCWLIAEPKTSEMLSGSQPENVSHFVCEDKGVVISKNSPQSPCQRDTIPLGMGTNPQKTVNKQPLSPQAGTYSSIVDEAVFTQAPSKGKKSTRPARLDMFDVLEDHKPQRILFHEPEDSHIPITNPTFVTEESEDQLALGEARTTSRTREDMQVLGLALEVKSIEQKLSKLKTSTVNAQPPAPRPARSVKGSVQQMGEKQTNRYCGLAGKFSQFAKQIGLTKSNRKVAANPPIEVKKESSPVLQSDLCLRKNPLFFQETSAFELASLHKRAETVGRNLAAIKAKLERENSLGFCKDYKPSLHSKGKLLDTVRSHLFQVQGALRNSKPTKTTSAPRSPSLSKSNQCTAPKALTPRKLSSTTNPSTPSGKRYCSTKTLTPPGRITSSKQASSPPERWAGSATIRTPPKTTMRELLKDDSRTRAAFGRRETKPAMHDQWTRKTYTQDSLRMDLEHLR
ncbi:uncharacterized protein [Physcomitrium patens]|uniref:Uncharacterized protein n=1 Tax=Physcomitrium patens TaxID=3218 RepID=A0A2K1L9X4_PHYPA|nr:myosin-9-like isoform X1 [Physcomitrium patens]PNR62823.1 hypothetical protein PHYPA_001247 [Physcomitrium patens]|eukprot:XP_024391301.1 myosin-9-like isoform X1 [Physcomitrella patens]